MRTYEDDPLWHTLTGRHASFAIGSGSVRRFVAGVSNLAALAPDATSSAWIELKGLLEPGEAVAFFFFEPAPSIPDDSGLRVVYEGDYHQMVCTSMTSATHPSVPFIHLGAGDVADMLALVELTQPGPFAERTIELGRFIGVRHNGQLVAMAGERCRFAGFREVSAVCTHPDFRERGLAEALVRDLGSEAQMHDEVPVLHVRGDNDVARRAYERIGFTIRRPMKVIAVQRLRSPA